MKTTKAFSTVSYNTNEFLINKLNELIKMRKIAFYSFIKHYAEEDECKAHIHLFIMPNGQIDTNAFCDYLVELDPLHIDTPFECLPCRFSKFADWFLYACHDSAYLVTKGQARKYHYKESEFTSSNADFLHELVSTIDNTKYRKTLDFVEKVKNGATFESFVVTGQIPAPQFNGWKSLYDCIKRDTISRNGVSHSPLEAVVPETGEILEVDTTLPPPLLKMIDSEEPTK